MRLIITRPWEDADALKVTLERLGHSVILSPLLEIVPIDSVVPDEQYQVIALTSANAPRVMSRRGGLARIRGLPVLAVGLQSAEAARAAGFTNVQIAGGDAAGLAKHIREAHDSGAGPVLYLSGRDSAADFTGKLESAGFAVRRVIAYEAKPAAKLAPDVHSNADAVLLFSPRTARIWGGLVAREGLDAAARTQMHVCISSNTAAALPEHYPRRIATRPTEAAMLDVIAGLISRPR